MPPGGGRHLFCGPNWILRNRIGSAIINNVPEPWSRWKNSRWAVWLSLVFAVAGVYSAALLLYEAARYDAKASAAHNNEQFLVAYNERHSGDIVTIVGKSLSLSDRQARRGKFALVQLDGVDKIVALSDTAIPLCIGDRVAASGSYNYDPQGGTIFISDTRNISKQFGSVASQLDRVIWAFYPAWCGFPGDPISS
jgi:hypothetical protein